MFLSLLLNCAFISFIPNDQFLLFFISLKSPLLEVLCSILPSLQKSYIPDVMWFIFCVFIVIKNHKNYFYHVVTTKKLSRSLRLVFISATWKENLRLKQCKNWANKQFEIHVLLKERPWLEKQWWKSRSNYRESNHIYTSFAYIVPTNLYRNPAKGNNYISHHYV